MIGCLALGSLENGRKTFEWVRGGLAETGYVEGRDFDLELRAADYQAERLRELAADLVARNVAAIVALTTPSTAAALAVTKSVPIVFLTGVDPVANGFVSSLNRPGGNATGIFILGQTLSTKRLELLHEIAPTANVVAILISSSIPGITTELSDAADRLGVRTIIQVANSRDEFAAASRQWFETTAARFMCLAMPSSTTMLPPLSPWPRSIGSQLYIRFENTRRLAGWPATGQISPRAIGLSEPMLVAFCEASGPPSCPCSKSRRSNWSLTPTQPKNWASNSH
ncbi:ABC transporter substrate-binding protein [Bradyrhizobium sp. CB1717]|uniref:ABC transporter substrate-binding protein n=1 Tax=Bradyrhizobium sp. CB1717 TaxID=3039154 RepID=UPI0024B08828|nr:ABC transporter substrate-binding protein [Bradyrhizobium sp. CB1717]WFU21738.1 ABC transporter substrate-binding protein [Bradyrhizobium sp. CB1717]